VRTLLIATPARCFLSSLPPSPRSRRSQATKLAATMSGTPPDQVACSAWWGCLLGAGWRQQPPVPMTSHVIMLDQRVGMYTWHNGDLAQDLGTRCARRPAPTGTPAMGRGLKVGTWLPPRHTELMLVRRSSILSTPPSMSACGRMCRGEDRAPTVRRGVGVEGCRGR